MKAVQHTELVCDCGSVMRSYAPLGDGLFPGMTKHQCLGCKRVAIIRGQSFPSERTWEVKEFVLKGIELKGPINFNEVEEL